MVQFIIRAIVVCWLCLGLSQQALGVKSPDITERFNIVGVISQSGEKTEGIVVLKDQKRKSSVTIKSGKVIPRSGGWVVRSVGVKQVTIERNGEVVSLGYQGRGASAPLARTYYDSEFGIEPVEGEDLYSYDPMPSLDYDQQDQDPYEMRNLNDEDREALRHYMKASLRDDENALNREELDDFARILSQVQRERIRRESDLMRGPTRDRNWMRAPDYQEGDAPGNFDRHPMETLPEDATGYGRAGPGENSFPDYKRSQEPGYGFNERLKDYGSGDPEQTVEERDPIRLPY